MPLIGHPGPNPQIDHPGPANRSPSFTSKIKPWNKSRRPLKKWSRPLKKWSLVTYSPLHLAHVWHERRSIRPHVHGASRAPDIGQSSAEVTAIDIDSCCFKTLAYCHIALKWYPHFRTYHSLSRWQKPCKSFTLWALWTFEGSTGTRSATASNTATPNRASSHHIHRRSWEVKWLAIFLNKMFTSWIKKARDNCQRSICIHLLAKWFALHVSRQISCTGTTFTSRRVGSGSTWLISCPPKCIWKHQVNHGYYPKKKIRFFGFIVFGKSLASPFYTIKGHTLHHTSSSSACARLLHLSSHQSTVQLQRQLRSNFLRNLRSSLEPHRLNRTSGWTVAICSIYSYYIPIYILTLFKI